MDNKNILKFLFLIKYFKKMDPLGKVTQRDPR